MKALEELIDQLQRDTGTHPGTHGRWEREAAQHAFTYAAQGSYYPAMLFLAWLKRIPDVAAILDQKMAPHPHQIQSRTVLPIDDFSATAINELHMPPPQPTAANAPPQAVPDGTVRVFVGGQFRPGEILNQFGPIIRVRITAVGGSSEVADIVMKLIHPGDRERAEAIIDSKSGNVGDDQVAWGREEDVHEDAG